MKCSREGTKGSWVLGQNQKSNRAPTQQQAFDKPPEPSEEGTHKEVHPI
jgi:hypothetical protein